MEFFVVERCVCVCVCVYVCVCVCVRERERERDRNIWALDEYSDKRLEKT